MRSPSGTRRSGVLPPEPSVAVLGPGITRDRRQQTGGSVGTQRGDDIDGLGVNIAARIEAWARPGEILGSRRFTEPLAG